MSTAPQPPVSVTPPLKNRRNAELLLVFFAAAITAIALLIVEANQEQGLTLDLAGYTLAYLALFVGAHLVIRRFAPYADPLLLPETGLAANSTYSDLLGRSFRVGVRFKLK